MSKKEKVPRKDYSSETGKLSRREFIRNTGLIAGGTTIGTGIIHTFGGSRRVEAKDFQLAKAINEKWSFEVPPPSIPKSRSGEAR